MSLVCGIPSASMPLDASEFRMFPATGKLDEQKDENQGWASGA